MRLEESRETDFPYSSSMCGWECTPHQMKLCSLVPSIFEALCERKTLDPKNEESGCIRWNNRTRLEHHCTHTLLQNMIDRIYLSHQACRRSA